MKSERGSALILALIMLSFLMILGSSLLTSVTLDVEIGNNYRKETQLLYLAETGVDEARNLLRTSTSTPSQLLVAAAAGDGVISASRDLDTLLNSTDDVPLVGGATRLIGKSLLDTTGIPAGSYYVFLRNDSADGTTSLTDSNQVLTLLSVAVLGNSRKVLEVTVMKWRFPSLPASLILDGSPSSFVPSSSSAGVSGLDASASGGDRNALGVLTTIDKTVVLAGIPVLAQVRYPGIGSWSPPPADVEFIDSQLDSRLRTPAGMEEMIDTILANATDVYHPGWNGSTLLGNIGTPADYRVAVVDGDCELGTGNGYGLLVVRGNLTISGNAHWNGLILAIGQGTLTTSGSASGAISGAVLVARTRAADRSAVNEFGTVLVSRGGVSVDFSVGGVQVAYPGSASIHLVNQKFPYLPIAIREY